MTSQHGFLNGRWDRPEQHPASHSSRHMPGAGWRVSKRSLSVLATTLGLLFALYLFFWRPSPSTISNSGEPIPTYSTSQLYLLGETEDATKFWFPPLVQSHYLPIVAPYNTPPVRSRRPRTPLFIAFTRNNAMLQQTVLSYLAAGWPREDIVVVDNTGTMDANPRRLLSPTNPFFLDYDLFRRRYGVSILQTPTLLTFAQLMNFYLRVSMAHGWRYFFWSHMDVVVLSDESAQPYQSFYARVLSILTDLGITTLEAGTAHARSDEETWALKYFSYDWLTLINVPAWRKIGAWDPFIPYYATDCDAYSRVALNGLTKDDVRAGRIFDLSDTLPDPESKLFPASLSSLATDDGSGGAKQPGSDRYHALLAELEDLERKKPENHRNSWQGASDGGKGDPWTYDPQGFQKMWWATAEKGRDMYKMKWGTLECRLDEHGVKLEDAWTAAQA